MKSKLWKKHAVAAVVLLFLGAGVYLNWSYNRSGGDTVELADTLDTALLEEAARDTAIEEVAGTADASEEVVVLDEDVYQAVLAEAGTPMADYFAAIRLSRQESRDSAAELLQETIAYETGEDDETASAASAQLGDMVTMALQEAEIEGLVIAKGYADCVAYMSDGAISVAVAAPEEGLTAESVAQICDIVTTQSGYSPSQLKIIEVR